MVSPLHIFILQLHEFTLTSHLAAQGASFGAMFCSGVKAAKEAIKLYDSYEIIEGEVVGPKRAAGNAAKIAAQ